MNTLSSFQKSEIEKLVSYRILSKYISVKVAQKIEIFKILIFYNVNHLCAKRTDFIKFISTFYPSQDQEIHRDDNVSKFS